MVMLHVRTTHPHSFFPSPCPASPQVLFERAVAAFPVTAELWLQYLAYLEHTLKITSLVTQVTNWGEGSSLWVGVSRLCLWNTCLARPSTHQP